MAITKEEKIKILRKFKPVEILKATFGVYRPENCYALVFHPSTSTFTVHQMTEMNSTLPIISCSYQSFVDNVAFANMKLAVNRWPENILLRMRTMWSDMPKFKRKMFVDRMPLMSMTN